MDNDLKNYVDVVRYDGEGYKPVINYEAWRVAYLNYTERFDEKYFESLERHLETDEVFVLLSGEAQLVIGNMDGQRMKIRKTDMNTGTVYNVKKNVWHHIFVSKDARVLIVENDNTSQKNTEYYEIKDI